MAHQEKQPAYLSNPTIRWIEYRLPIFSTLDHFIGTSYPAPRNLSYWWNFGSIAGFMLVVMIVTGVFLAMNYQPNTALAFDSIERIMRDVNWGWLLRYVHMNGASMFFVAVYIHVFRGLYYGSYKAPRELLWWLGVVILILMMATAFMGYSLVWGQMSYWAVTVITNLFSAIPLVGNWIVTLLWGGFSVDNATLNRFYALHYLLPFVIVGVVMLHMLALHQHGSNNPLGIDAKGPQDKIPFHPYYTAKDLFGLAAFLILYAAFVFFAPNVLGDPVNYVEANPLSTPPHIVPEWYFLPYYAMLRAITFDIGIPFTNIVFIEAKLGGVIAMFGSLLILFVLPWLDTSRVRSGAFRPRFKIFFWLFVIDCVLLGYIGSQLPEPPYIGIGQVATLYYFAYFLVILPVLGWFERPKPMPKSIAESVLGGGALAGAKTMEKA